MRLEQKTRSFWRILRRGRDNTYERTRVICIPCGGFQPQITLILQMFTGGLFYSAQSSYTDIFVVREDEGVFSGHNHCHDSVISPICPMCTHSYRPSPSRRLCATTQPDKLRLKVITAPSFTKDRSLILVALAQLPLRRLDLKHILL